MKSMPSSPALPEELEHDDVEKDAAARRGPTSAASDPGLVRVLRTPSGETDNELMPWMIGGNGPPR